MLPFTEKLLYKTPSKLPDELVNSMVDYVTSLHYTNAGVDGHNEGNVTRSSAVSWINWDEWIPGIIHNMMVSANKEYFNYDLEYFGTKIQSTIYEGGQKDHYTWHCDNGTSSTRNGMERKLSCSLLLSGPDEYTNGEFQLHYERTYFKSLRPERGECIIFPAWVPHRVRPVTSGKRISIVAWMVGPMFR